LCGEPGVRRQLRYSVLQQNKLAPKTFNDYLAGKPLKGQTKMGTKDAWTTRAAILANPTMKKPTKAPRDSLAGLMGGGNVFPKGVGINQPGDVVFFEQPSTLKKKNGTRITKWTFV
jgi:hypothetical protein